MEAPVVGAVLIDVDGTLLDSNDAHARASVDVLQAAQLAALDRSLLAPRIV